MKFKNYWGAIVSGMLNKPKLVLIRNTYIHCASNTLLMPFTSRIDLVNRISVSRHNIVWSVNHTVTAIWAVTSPFTILRIMKVQNHFFHRFVLSELHFWDRIVWCPDFGTRVDALNLITEIEIEYFKYFEMNNQFF